MHCLQAYGRACNVALLLFVRLWAASAVPPVQNVLASYMCSEKCWCAGKPHQFWNSNNVTDLDMQFTITPAGSFESFIRTFCGLAVDTGSVQNINPLQLMVMFTGGGMQIAAMPRPLWLFIEHAVVPLLQFLRIYQPTYPQYTA